MNTYVQSSKAEICCFMKTKKQTAGIKMSQTTRQQEKKQQQKRNIAHPALKPQNL